VALQKFSVLVLVENSLKTVFLKQVKERQKPPFLTFPSAIFFDQATIVTQTSNSVKTTPSVRCFGDAVDCSSGLENQNNNYEL
jgi:hypothetical protein